MMLRARVALLALVALTHGSPTPVSDENKVLDERQFTIGPPITGGMNPPIPSIYPGPIVFPPQEKRQDSIGIGGSDPSALKAYLTSLELEYESLTQKYGKHPPEAVAKRLRAIEKELAKYGITIVQSPDGTSTTITPGKARRHTFSIGDGGYGNAASDLEGLEKTLENLMQQYGDNPPHDVYIVEERIKHILLAYGITIIKSPDGTTPTITLSSKRSTTTIVAAPYSVKALSGIFESAAQPYARERPPLANWLVLQDIAAICSSYGIDVWPTATMTISPSTKRQDNTTSPGDAVNTVALQALMAILVATYGNTPPRDIFIIEQTIATILNSKGIPVPGWGSTIPGGPMVPDPYVPGGPITPDPYVPGGPIVPSDRKRGNSGSEFDINGLQAALAQFEAQYGTYGSASIPVPIFVIMQNIVTILQAEEGVQVAGWPNLGQGSTTIEPSD